MCTLILPAEYNFGLLYTLFHCYFCVVQQFSKFCHEFENFKKFLKRLPTKIYRTTNFQNFEQSIGKLTRSKEGIYNCSSLIRKFVAYDQTNKVCTKNLIFCQLQVILITTNRLSNYFGYKDLILEILHSSRAYKSSGGIHTSSCIGKTCKLLKVSVSEH